MGDCLLLGLLALSIFSLSLLPFQIGFLVYPTSIDNRLDSRIVFQTLLLFLQSRRPLVNAPLGVFDLLLFEQFALQGSKAVLEHFEGIVLLSASDLRGRQCKDGKNPECFKAFGNTH